MVDLTDTVARPPSGDEGARWARSGAMALTGRPGHDPLGVPAGVVRVLTGAADRLAELAVAGGSSVVVDGLALLGERAALAGWERRGDISCGGASRLLAGRDGWIALSLARPEDIEMIPAWLEQPIVGEPWSTIRQEVACRAVAPLVTRGAELGLPIAALGERPAGGQIELVHGGHAPPSARWHGLRVLDLSSLWAGPLCGSLLAMAGMDVVKFESTTRPDGARRGNAEFFSLLNSTKRSVAADLSSADGRDLLRRLLGAADVIVESSRPRAMGHLGIDPLEVLGTGRAKVWVSITGHGRQGCAGGRVGFGDDSAVAGGLVALDSAGPVFCADAVADPASGLIAAWAVLDRLIAGGRWLVDVPLAGVAAHLAGGPIVGAGRPASEPTVRPIPAGAPPLGAHTADVVGAWRLG